MCGDKDLFGNEIIPHQEIKTENRASVIAHKKLIQVYGETSGKKCKACDLLRRKRWDKAYFKCALFRNTNSPATDWRVGWQACGKFIETKK